jgi:hypothetical protein
MKKTVYYIVAAVACLIGTQHCEYVPEEVPFSPIDTIRTPLNDTVSLSGTKWKLVGFVDTATNKIKRAYPEGQRCFKLIFNKDSTLSGRSSTNTIAGRYTIEQKLSKIQIQIQTTTEVDEVLDGILYLKTINAVQYVSVKDEKLMLYYNGKENYLLYEEDTDSVNNPLPSGLPQWLLTFIDEKIKEAETEYVSSISIYQCTYNDGEIGFLIDYPKGATTLYDHEGIALCTTGGITGDACNEYTIDYTNQILIWEY